MGDHIRTHIVATLLWVVLLTASIPVVQSSQHVQKKIGNGQESFRPPNWERVTARMEQEEYAFFPDKQPNIPLAHLKGQECEFYRIVISPDQKTIITSDLQGYVGWWDRTTGVNRRLTKVRGKGGYAGSCRALSVSRGGRLLVSGHSRSVICIWDLPTGKQIRTLSLPPDRSSMGVIGLAFSPDDAVLAAAVENSIHLFDLRSGKEIRRIHTGECVTALAWDPNNNLLATGHQPRVFEVRDPVRGILADTESMVQLWNAATGQRVRTIRWGKGSLFALSFSPDGRLLATGDSHRTGRLVFWDVATGRELASVPAHPEQESQKPLLNTETLPPQGGIRSIAFSPDGCLLVSGGGDGMVRLWEVASARELCHFDAGRNPTYPSHYVFSVAFTPNGHSVASAHEHASALLWDLRRSITGENPLPAKLSPAQLEKCWVDLASPQPLPAYRAVEQLRCASGVSLPFVRERCRPLLACDASLLGQWVADLDSNDFSMREKATHNLKLAGEQVINHLQKALLTKPSLEVRQRIRDILAAVETSRTTPDRLRLLRTLRLLERIGTSEAQQVVESLAKNDARLWLSQDAKTTLERMQHLPEP